MRALATFQDSIELSGWMSIGRMMPSMRTYTLPWLSVSHFWPRTTRLPLPSRRTTVALISPESRLLCALEPVPLNSDSFSMPICSTCAPFTVTGRPAIVGPGSSAEVDFLVLVVALLLACVRSALRLTSS